MKLKAVTDHKLFKPALGGALAVVCGLGLYAMPLGERWVNLSYDYLFRFDPRSVTNKVVLILMDQEAHAKLHQIRGQPWDRAVHADLLTRLAADNCPLVVFDSFFGEAREPTKDQELAEAMRSQHSVVLMADQTGATYRNTERMLPLLPTEPFLSAALTNGVAWRENSENG